MSTRVNFAFQTKISRIHDAVVRGSLVEVQRLVDAEPKKKLVVAKDSSGTPLIHKAVYYDHQNVLEWIIDNYPSTVEQKDRVPFNFLCFYNLPLLYGSIFD